MGEQQPEAPAIPGITRWRKKPVTVSAIQWTGANLAEVLAFTGSAYFGTVPPEDRDGDPDMTAEVYDKLHGTWVHVYDGQWIIRGIQGELYPYAADVFAATYEPAGAPAAASPSPAPAGPSAEATGPAEAFQADLAALREQVEAALNRSIDRCARCKICDTQINAAMAAVGAEFDRLHAALEHAVSAAAGSHEGIRLWMLDCGELTARHRARAEAAEARLAAVAAYCRNPGHDYVGHLMAERILAIIGSEEERP